MSKSIAVIGLLGLAVLVGGCPPSSDIVACDPLGCISEQRFADNIVTSLQASPGVAGYVVIVGGLPSVFSGNAVLSSSSAIVPSDITNIESLSKMLTTFAVLKSLSNHNISLDTPIYPYLYSDWQSLAPSGGGIAPGLLGQPQVTFRDLLTHRSGWPNDSNTPPGCSGNVTSYATLKAKIQLSTTPIPRGTVGQYSNCNFAIFRELLPQMEQYSAPNAVPDNINGINLRAPLSAAFYINYVNQNVLGPGNVAGLRNCSPSPNPTMQMLWYPPPPYQPPNYPSLSAVPHDGTVDWTLTCGAGGWYLSAGDLFQVFNALATGKLLTPAQQAELYNTNSSNFPGLGWDNTVNNCPGSNTNGQTYYWCKNGGETDVVNNTTIGIETFAGLFKCNAVPVIVVVNSPLPSPYTGTGQITQLVTNAFASSSASGGPRSCPGTGGG
jgi:CubicO group peptidase (beta-lactamase class C family)